MKYFFADYFHKYFIRAGDFLQRFRDFLHDIEILADIGDIPYPSMMLFRYDERVARRERTSIEESEKPFVFIYAMRRHGASDDVAKDAVVHIL